MRKILLVLTMMSMLIFTACGNDSDSIVTTASTTTEAVTTEPSQTENPVTVTHSDVSEPDITEPAVTTEAVSDQITTTTTVVSEDTQNPVTVTHSEVTTVTTTVPVTTEKTTTTATTKPATTTTVPTTAEQTTTTTTAPVTTTVTTTVAPVKNSYYDEQMEAEMLAILNRIRAENGLNTFTQDENWAIFADRYARYLGDNDIFGHSGIAREIIAGSPLSWNATKVMESFMNSAGHKRNILDQAGWSTTHCAVSCYRHSEHGIITVIVLENESYEEHFTYGEAVYTEEFFRTCGNVSDDFILSTQNLTDAEKIEYGYYKPEYNIYYPHLAQ